MLACGCWFLHDSCSGGPGAMGTVVWAGILTVPLKNKRDTCPFQHHKLSCGKGNKALIV